MRDSPIWTQRAGGMSNSPFNRHFVDGPNVTSSLLCFDNQKEGDFAVQMIDVW